MVGFRPFIFIATILTISSGGHTDSTIFYMKILLQTVSAEKSITKTPNTYCTPEHIKNCPEMPKTCVGPNKVLEKGGEDHCCDMCYTLLDKYQSCDNPNNPRAECAGAFLCVNGVCQ